MNAPKKPSPVPVLPKVGNEKEPEIPGGEPSYVVGIGASAGGLEALRSFFSAMPLDTGMAFVVIQHLAPDYKSLMVELLARLTKLPILRAEENMKVEANRIYLIPPRFNLTISGGHLHLEAPPAGKVLNLPIDIFFRSLAQDCGDRAIAVILSGTGSDGARGIRAVKEAGGMVMVQAEASAKFAGMPSSAIATGTADFVLPVEEMPGQLVNFARHPFAVRPPDTRNHIPEDASQLERICARLRDVTGIDFTNYKTATLVRRIERRMNIAQIQDINEYLQYILQSRQESEALGKDLLIGVTKFFRDADSFLALETLLPQLFEAVQPRRTLRVWSAACSTGEEAYTLAMLCNRVREERFPRVDLKVFATDVDRAALEIASAGLYPRSVIADLPTDLIERNFVPEGNDHYRINRALRDRLIFARQDLLNDPPFTKIDLISCRNLLIYLRPAAQKKLLSLLHFALQPGGLLFLGTSETLGDMSYAFETLDSRHRIFRKLPGIALRAGDCVSGLQESTAWATTLEERQFRAAPRRSPAAASEAIQRHLLERFAPATIVCTTQYELVYSLGNIADYLQVPTGPARLDVLKMAPRDLSLAISTAGAQAQREARIVEYRSVRYLRSDGKEEFLRVSVEPYDTKAESGLLLIITIHPDTAAQLEMSGAQNFDFDQKLLERVQELERELQNTRENLQASIEQQETSNEELQAANEELLAANEELQSTNEELESVNEELYTVNAEYQSKIQELTEANDDMENFARSTDIATVFLDEDLRLRRFTPTFAELTELVATDTGRVASAFAHPVLTAIVKAAPEVRRTRKTHEEVLALPDRGEFLLRLQLYKQAQSEVSGLVASLVDITRLRNAEKELEAILRTVDVGICVTDEKGHFVQVNDAYCSIYGYRREELIGQHFTVVVPEPDRAKASQLHEEFIRTGCEIPGVWDVVAKDGRMLKVGVRASLLQKSPDKNWKVTVVTDLSRPFIPN